MYNVYLLQDTHFVMLRRASGSAQDGLPFPRPPLSLWRTLVFRYFSSSFLHICPNIIYFLSFHSASLQDSFFCLTIAVFKLTVNFTLEAPYHGNSTFFIFKPLLDSLKRLLNICRSAYRPSRYFAARTVDMNQDQVCLAPRYHSHPA
jgi:hypothetical protein